MAPYIRVGKYIVKKKIGEGAFAEVRLAVHEETKIEYAVKVFNRSLLQRNRFENDVKKEIRIMQHLRHPNIVSIHAVLVTASKMYLVMEYVRGGELYDEIVANGRIDEDTSRHYFQQLVDAMAYCHRRGVVHRDLKPENLLLDGNGNLKVTDFGMSFMKAATQDASQMLLSTQCGTPKYMAPEVILRPPEGYDGQKLDVWECGMVLYALLAGFLPFHGDDDNTVFRSILSGKVRFPSFFSDGAKDILQTLLEKDPSKRASLEQVKQHPWFLVNYRGDSGEGNLNIPRPCATLPKPSAPRPPKIPTSPVSPRSKSEYSTPSVIPTSMHLLNQYESQKMKQQSPAPYATETSNMRAEPNTQSAAKPSTRPDIIQNNPGYISNSRNSVAMHQKLPESLSDTSSEDATDASPTNTNTKLPHVICSIDESKTCIPPTAPEELIVPPLKIQQPSSNIPDIGKSACSADVPLTPVTQWRENIKLDLANLENEPTNQFFESPLAATPQSGNSTFKQPSTKAAIPPKKNTGTPSSTYGDKAPRTVHSSNRFPKSLKSFKSIRVGSPQEKQTLPDRESEALSSASPAAPSSITGNSMRTLFRSIRSLGSGVRTDRCSVADQEDDDSSWFTARSDPAPLSDSQLGTTKGAIENVNRWTAGSRLDDIPPTSPAGLTPTSTTTPKAAWRFFQRPGIFR